MMNVRKLGGFSFTGDKIQYWMESDLIKTKKCFLNSFVHPNLPNFNLLYLLSLGFLYFFETALASALEMLK